MVNTDILVTSIGPVSDTQMVGAGWVPRQAPGDKHEDLGRGLPEL